MYLEEEGDHRQAVVVLEGFVLAPVCLPVVNQMHLHWKAGIWHKLRLKLWDLRFKSWSSGLWHRRIQTFLTNLLAATIFLHPEDGGRMVLRNAGILPHHTLS